MILKIDFNERDVIYQGDGQILLSIKYYSKFGDACHLATTKGTTKEDFENAEKALSHKRLFVGKKGGITF